MVEFRERLKRLLGLDDERLKEELIKLGRQIDDYYRREEAEERDTERAEEILEEKPSWMLNAELLEEARAWVKPRLENILRMPYPDRIHKYHDLIKECLEDAIAGEESNKVNALVIIGFGQNYILLSIGRSSIGKNRLFDAFIPLVPHYMRKRWTKHVGSYLDPEKVKDKVLYIRELPTVEEELGLFLKSIEEFDGRIIFSTDYVMRDPITGKLVVETNKVPIKAFVGTSNREDIRIPGLMERTFLIRMDASREMDRRYAKYQARIDKQKEEVKLKLREWTDQELSLARTYWLHRFALRCSEPILIPYPSLAIILEEKLGDVFPNEIRRLIKRVRMYLEWFARLFAPVLPSIEFRGQKYRLLDPETLKIALAYFMDLIRHKEEFKKPKLLKFAERLVGYLMEHGQTGTVYFGKEERRVLARSLSMSEVTVRRYLNRLEQPDVASFAVSSHQRGVEKVFVVDVEQLSAWVSEWVPAETTFTEDDLERLREDLRAFSEEHELDLPNEITYIGVGVDRSGGDTGGESVFPEKTRSELINSKNIKSDQVIPGKNLGEPSKRADRSTPDHIEGLLKVGAEGDIYKPFGEPSEKPGDLHEELLSIPKPDYDHCFVCLGSDGVELLELAGHKIPVCRDENCRRIFKKIEGLVEFIESRGGVVDYKTLENAGLMRTAMLCRSLCSVVKTDGFRYWIKRGDGR